MLKWPLVALAALTIASPLAAQDLTPVRFSLDWKFEGPSAPFFVAIDKGYFKDEGLDVTIDSGAGARESIPRVATGAYDMGFGDLNAVVKFLAEQPDAAVEAVYVVYEKPPFAVIGRRSQGITEDPKSLEGKTIGAPPPDAAFAQWPAFVDATGIDTSGITLESVGFPMREPMLALGQVDAIFGFSFSSVLNLKAQGVPDEDVVTIFMADNGLDLFGNAIIVNTEWAEANPAAVRGFLAALTKGIKDAAAAPEEAIKSVMERNDIADEAVELARLQMALDDNIVTEVTETDGLGDADMDRLAASIVQLQSSFDMPNPPSAERAFNSEYLPPLEARMPN